MEHFIGRFEAALVEAGGGRCRVVVQAGPEPLRELSALLDVVQCWVDREDANHATIYFRDRTYTMGSRMAATLDSRSSRPLRRVASRPSSTTLLERSGPEARG
jgi:hypothetical protein